MDIALTCDDAPTIVGNGAAVRANPERLDTVREILQAAGVTHCLAFVIGSVAEGEAARLERWLDAGYALGNHTFDHLKASEHEPVAFLENVRRCDELLTAMDAFRGGAKFFRFPYLNRGRDAAQRGEIQRGLGAMGYRTVPGTIDFYDHHYEERHADALVAGDEAAAARVGRRFVDVAVSSVTFRAAAARARLGRDPIHLPYFHIGHVSSRYLGEILARLDATWKPVDDALDDPAYVDYERDLAKTGLVTDYFLASSFAQKVRRRLIQQTEARGWFRQAADGPRWPHRY